MKPKSLVELQKVHDKLVVELAVLSRGIYAWKAEQRKPKRPKK